MNRTLASALLVLVAIVGLPIVVPAQSATSQTSSISGRVGDSQGGVVAGATVSLTSGSGRRIDTVTGSDGAFAFNQIAAGPYTLRVEAPGFTPWSQRIATGAASGPLTVTLQVAGLNEAISVIGAAPTTLGIPTVTATRLGLTSLDTPASVSIISGDTIRERGDQTVAEAKTRAVGVTMQGDPGNGGGAVVARGFGGVGSVMQLFDGDQLFVGAGTVTFPFDPWMVERIEVLGGPASVLYGNGAIGGAVNVVPRKPNPFSNERALRFTGGSFNTWRGAFDAAGPLSSGTSYRLDVSGNRSDTWVSNNPSSSAAFSGSLRHEFNRTVSLTLSEDFGHQRPGEYFGTPTIDGLIDESRRDVKYNVGDSDIWYRDSWTQAKLEWQPSPSVRVRSGLHLLATNRLWSDAEEYVFNPDTGLIDRDSYIEIGHRQRQYGDRTELTVSNRVFGNRSNTASIGFDYNFVSFRHSNNSPYGGASVTDLDNTNPGLFLHLDPTLPKYETHTHQTALFAEDRLAITDKVALIGGARFDRYAAKRENLITQATANRTYTPASWRGGAVFTASPGVSLYGQVATATETIGDIISNNPQSMLLDPTTGRQIEAGVKQTIGSRVEWTFAGYHIVKEKLLAPIPGRPGEVQQIGSQSSRGVELTAAATLRAGFRVEGNLALLDARFDDFAEEIDGVLVSRNGKTPPSVPERSINLWVTWNAPQDWQFRAGLRSVGRRYWDNTNTTAIPTYNVVDAGVRKRLTRAVGIDLRLNNLTDELYATDFYYNGYAPQWMLGMPRSAELSLNVAF